MSTVGMIALEKSGRARHGNAPARPKSGEEEPEAPDGDAKGSHDRREVVAIASRSGDGRKIGAFGGSKEVVRTIAHATSRRCSRINRSASTPGIPLSAAASMIAGQ